MDYPWMKGVKFIIELVGISMYAMKICKKYDIFHKKYNENNNK